MGIFPGAVALRLRFGSELRGRLWRRVGPGAHGAAGGCDVVMSCSSCVLMK